MGVRVGISTPWDLWDLEPEQQRARLAAIADGGIDHVFSADHVSFVGGHGIDGLTHLAAVAGLEPRLDLEVGVMLLALRHPMVAARQIASLAQVAPGRLTVGVGVGGEDRHEFEVCGIDPATRGARTDVAMLLVRRLLEGETVDGDGRFFDFEAGRIRPTPPTRVPFVVGGRSDAALSRVARLGDGWLATWCSPRRFAEATAKITAMATERRVAWRHGLQAWIGVGDTPAEGRSHVATAMERFYGLNFELFERYTPVGTPEQIASLLSRYVEAGASLLNLTPCGPSREAEAEAVMAIRDLLRR